MDLSSERTLERLQTAYCAFTGARDRKEETQILRRAVDHSRIVINNLPKGSSMDTCGMSSSSCEALLN
jgi:hypothetical protein